MFGFCLDINSESFGFRTVAVVSFNVKRKCTFTSLDYLSSKTYLPIRKSWPLGRYTVLYLLMMLVSQVKLFCVYVVISFGIFFFVRFHVYESSRGYNVENKNWFLFTCIMSLECLAEGGCAMRPAIQDCGGAAMKSLYCSAGWTLQGHLVIQEVCCSLAAEQWLLWLSLFSGAVFQMQLMNSLNSRRERLWQTTNGKLCSYWVRTLDWALSECVRVAGILQRREYLHQPCCSYGHLSKRSICLTVTISVLRKFGICYFETPV